MALPRTQADVDRMMEAYRRNPPAWDCFSDSAFIRAITDGPQIFYCPACQAMAYIGRLWFFKPEPWRRDTFSWKNPPINKRTK